MIRRLVLALLFPLLLPNRPAAAVQRVVSLNLCTDQMLVLLAPEKIAGLSVLARDPALSFVAAQAAAMPVARTSAEAVLRLRPDLVLAARFGAQTTLSVLEQERVRVIRIDLPVDWPGVRTMTRDLAALLGEPARAQTLIAAMDAALAAPSVIPGKERKRAIALEARLYLSGPKTILGAAMRAAGLSAATDAPRTTLETLVRHPPDLLVVPMDPAFPSLATDMLDHPALLSIPRRIVPPNLTICPGPFSAQAVALLRP